MPSLVYSPVLLRSLQLSTLPTAFANEHFPLGLPAARLRDGGLHGSHHSDALYREAQDLHLHIGKSAGSKVTIWHEGKRNPLVPRSIESSILVG